MADTSSTPSHANFVPDIDLLDQHFLTDPAIARAVVDAASITGADVVADLGAGAGILTRAVLDDQPARVIAVEIDRRCRRWLDPLAESSSRSLTVVWADLRALNAELESSTVVVANPPFTLMHHVVLILRALPELRSAVLVTGSRWARAVAATPGTRDYRRSSLHIQSRFAVKPLGVIQGSAFHPPINTSAALTRLTRIDGDPLVDLLAEADLHRANLRVKDVLRGRPVGDPSLVERLANISRDPAVRTLQQRRLQQLTAEQLSRLVATIASSTPPTV